MSKVLFEKLNNLTGMSFVGIRGYESKTTGEVADHTVNIGLRVDKAKQDDLELLMSEKADQAAIEVSEESGIDLETCQKALAELRASAQKNVGAFEGRTNQSKSQSEAYITHPNYPAIRLHKSTFEVHIYGLATQKKVIKKGEYKTVNSAPKTIAKGKIKKALNLKSGKFRTFVVANINEIKINGDLIELGR